MSCNLMNVPDTISHIQLAELINRSPGQTGGRLGTLEEMINYGLEEKDRMIVQENVSLIGKTTFKYIKAVFFLKLIHLKRYIIVSKNTGYELSDPLTKLKYLLCLEIEGKKKYDKIEQIINDYKLLDIK